MRIIIAAINLTVDGYCDHTSGVPDADIHRHYSDLLNDGDVILYGRKTFQLMEFWKSFLQQPSSDNTMNDFAQAIDRIPKIVFSNTINDTGWESAMMATTSLEDTVIALRSKPGKPVYAGSRSIINQLLKLNLVDELQLCFHPVIAGGGLPLFDLKTKYSLRLIKTKTFPGGAVILYYIPTH